MAIGWISLLKTVPWADVISTAPAVADGAKKLWKTVAQKAQSDAAPPAASAPMHRPEDATLAQLQSQIAAMESQMTELQQQMLVSSELINALASQNTELVKRAQANRVRLLWLSALVVMVGALAATSLGLVLTR